MLDWDHLRIVLAIQRGGSMRAAAELARSAPDNSLIRSLSGLSGTFVTVVGETHVGDDPDDGSKKQGAGDDRAKAHAAIFNGLGQKVAKAGTERAGEDIGQPEAEDRVKVDQVVSDRQRSDDQAEQDAGRQVTQPEMLCHQIARGRAKRKGEQDRQPIPSLAPSGPDRMDRQGPFGGVPARKSGDQG